MTSEEFDRIIDEEIKSLWGENIYPPRMLLKLFSSVKNIETNEFIAAINHVAENALSQKAPSLAIIRQACMPAIQRAAVRQRSEKLRTLENSDKRCDICGNSGYIFALSRENPFLESVFLCNCEAPQILGYRANEGLTFWRPELGKKFELIENTGEGISRKERFQRLASEKIPDKNKKPEKKPVVAFETGGLQPISQEDINSLLTQIDMRTDDEMLV